MNIINKIKNNKEQRVSVAKKMQGYLPSAMGKDIQKWLKSY